MTVKKVQHCKRCGELFNVTWVFEIAPGKAVLPDYCDRCHPQLSSHNDDIVTSDLYRDVLG